MSAGWNTPRALVAVVLAASTATSVGMRSPRPVGAVSAQAVQIARTLGALSVPGARLSGRLEAGAAGQYAVQLTQGDYARVTVERPGSLTLRVVAPSGTLVADRARVEPLDGPEVLSWVAESSGDYRLELRPRERTRAAGEHAVRLDARRPADETDVADVRAERLFERGDAQRRAASAAAFRNAIDAYGEALTGWRATNNSRGEADALLAIGLAWRALSDNEKALESYQESLGPRRTAIDPWGEAFTLQNIALVYRTWGELEVARTFYEQAIAVGQASGDRRAQAEGLNGLARVTYESGDYQSTLHYNEQALPVSRALGDRRGEAYALNSVGTVYHAWGDTERAVEAYEAALALRQAIGDRLGESNTIGNIGQVYVDSGEPGKALPFIARSLVLARTLGNRRTEAASLTTQGEALEQLDDLMKARTAFGAAVDLARAAGDTRVLAEALAGMAGTEARRGQGAEAREHIAQARALLPWLGDPEFEARLLLRDAILERRLGEPRRALASVSRALDLVELQRRRISNQAMRAAYLAWTREAFELRIDLLMRLDAVEPAAGHVAEALHVSEQARARTLLDALAETKWNIREGVDPDLLAHELELRRRLNLAAARLAARAPREDRGTLGKALEAEVAAYQQVEADIRARSPRYATLTQPTPLSVAEIQQRVVDDDSILLEFSLGADGSYVWLVTPTAVSAYPLPGRKVIEDLARAVHSTFEASHRPGRAGAARLAAADLSRLILQPVAGALGQKRLLIVPDGALQFVPFAALPGPLVAGGVGREPLVVQHEVVQLPSASIVPELRAAYGGRRPAERTVAILADPVLGRGDVRVREAVRNVRAAVARDDGRPADLMRSADQLGAGSFERLRFTRQEARAIGALAAPGQSLVALDFDASRSTALRSDLAGYRYVHFASHAILNTKHPELSGIVLSLINPDGTPQDGFLRLHDIYNMHLGADLVVLSACQTALGREVRGEGLIGLTRGFMYAGAPRVMASLWDVRDEQTAELMTRFYRGLLRDGLRPAAALRAAQVSMLREPTSSAPAYWAGFVLQGEWR